MIFSVDRETEAPSHLLEQDFADLGLQERSDLQEWAINNPQISGEELLVIASEYQNFEQTRNRLDILALDPTGCG